MDHYLSLESKISFKITRKSILSYAEITNFFAIFK